MSRISVIAVLLSLLSMTVVFQGMLFLTGHVTVDEALVALELKESDALVLESLMDSHVPEADQLLQWKSLEWARTRLREERETLETLRHRLTTDASTTEWEQQWVQGLMSATEDSLAAQRRADAGRLARLYGQMKPADAARVLPRLEPELAANVLAALQPRASARILANLDPKTAASLSTRIGESRIGARRTPEAP